MRPSVTSATRAAVFASVNPSGMVKDAPLASGPAARRAMMSSREVPPANVYVPGLSDDSTPSSVTRFVNSATVPTRRAR